MPGRKASEELSELHHEFLDLGMCVELMVSGAARALGAAIDWRPEETASVGCGELAARAARVAERCRRIVLLYQPVAVDFREVTAVLRMAAELEHVGHLAAETAERAAALAALPEAPPEELDRMTAAAAGLVRRALDAYALRDAETVRAVSQTRAAVDDCAIELTDWLTDLMRVDPAAVAPGLSLFVVVRNLQHIAEHASALAEEVGILVADPDTRRGVVRASG
jgi:phosphate transport system protein